MSDKSKIGWCDATWNPVIGCTKVSDGCEHCYAIPAARKLGDNFGQADYQGLTMVHADGSPNWTGTVRTRQQELSRPFHWKRPRRIFVNSMSDLFHEAVPNAFIAQVFAVMARCPQHTFQILTKRPHRMQYLLSRHDFEEMVWAEMAALDRGLVFADADAIPEIPFPNVWLGVSTEDQAAADVRIPDLLLTPAAVRFISAEPLLGPLHLTWPSTSPPGPYPYINYLTGLRTQTPLHETGLITEDGPHLNWVIVGGESGPDYRLMNPAWAFDIKSQCDEAGVAFFFKQYSGPYPGMGSILPSWRKFPAVADADAQG